MPLHVYAEEQNIMRHHRSTARALDIQQLTASSPDGHTLTEIADKLAVPRSSLFPILHTLADRGFITQNPESMKYTIGMQAFVVGSACVGTNDAYRTIYNQMERLADACMETCQLGILDDNQVLYIGKVDSGEVIRLSSHVGKRLPVHCTSLGKALIAHLPHEEVRMICKEPLIRRTERTITDFRVLCSQLQQVRIDGIAKDYQETQENVNCQAIPLFRNAKPVCAISVSVPIFRFTEEKEQVIRSRLLEVKQILEVALARMQTALPF
jgi:DNA-binding IclR family transcriptional regulator